MTRLLLLLLTLLFSLSGPAMEEHSDFEQSSFAAKGSVFWSGDGARTAAEAFAKQSGGKTLEMTTTGRILHAITTKQTYPFVKPLWDRASANVAKNAKGPVDVFHSSEGVRLQSVWATKEYPQLIQQGNPINYHVSP